jgi:hypothetical protein
VSDLQGQKRPKRPKLYDKFEKDKNNEGVEILGQKMGQKHTSKYK